MHIAAIYTLIAGLLNILVIYDAAAGPGTCWKIRRKTKPNFAASERPHDWADHLLAPSAARTCSELRLRGDAT